MGKKVIIFIGIILAISFIVKFNLKYLKEQKEMGQPSNYLLTINRKQLCSSSDIKYYYTDSLNRKYYLHCIESIMVNSNSKSEQLNEVLKKDESFIDEILNTIIPEDIYNENYPEIFKNDYYSFNEYKLYKSTIYKNKEVVLYKDWNKKYSSSLSILKCDTKDNNDIYIGLIYMDYWLGNAENVCK